MYLVWAVIFVSSNSNNPTSNIVACRTPILWDIERLFLHMLAVMDVPLTCRHLVWYKFWPHSPRSMMVHKSVEILYVYCLMQIQTPIVHGRRCWPQLCKWRVGAGVPQEQGYFYAAWKGGKTIQKWKRVFITKEGTYNSRTEWTRIQNMISISLTENIFKGASTHPELWSWLRLQGRGTLIW